MTSGILRTFQPTPNSAVLPIARLSAITFFAQGATMLALSRFSMDASTIRDALLDAAFLAVFISPISYLLVIRPFLRRATAAKSALCEALAASRLAEKATASALADLRTQKTILDHHCLISKTDANGRITYANKEFCRVSGFTKDEFVGQTHKIVNAGYHPREFWAEMYSTIDRDGIWQGQVCNRAKNGDHFWVQATNIAEKDATGRIVGYFSVRSEITATKKREEELSRTQEELREAIHRAEAASRAKSGFLSTMSHEMRTPLNGVIGAMELLKKEALADKQRELVDIALQSGEALLVHINDVLDFSKMEAAKLDLVPKPFDVRKLVNTVTDIVSPMATPGGNRVVASVSTEIPEFLCGDVIRLRQILLNFTSNAAKFTRNGVITITADLAGGNSDNSTIEFSVTDTGLGIAQDRMGELFKEFSMLDSSFTRKTGGTGLGLAISKSLVEAMGGRIGVDSKEGVGSRFWFVVDLPRADGAGLAAKLEGDAPDRTATSLRVLLVDDNATNRFVGSRLVASAGHQVTLACSGREAVAAAATDPFDVVLMDISMPEMDGIEATQLIRTQSTLNSDTPIIALTAHAITGDRERFLAAGMNEYLSKPIRLSDLLERLEAVTRARKAESISGLLAVQEVQSDIAAPVIDEAELSLLAKATSGDIIPALVGEFLQELSVRADELSKAAESQDHVRLQAVAHAIAGACASTGALALKQLAKAIEENCIGARPDEALGLCLRAPALLATTERAYRQRYLESAEEQAITERAA